ncbi:MAG: glycosyltransferase family 4 protein [Pseudomonadota bacterium]
MTAKAAIFHHPDAIESDQTPLAGRRAAGQSFLGGYVRHSGAERLSCVTYTKAHIDHFRETVTSYGWTGPVDGTLIGDLKGLSAFDAIMLPGPTIGTYAWQRRRAGTGLYSLVGITHTVSTRRIMDGLFDLLAAPVEPWDAIICTSEAVKSVVAAELEEGARYLTARLGARRIPLPQMPVIPLGIDTGRFAHDPAQRARWRQELDIADDAIVLMSMGRLSVFEKMHPAPLFLAAARAAKETRRTVVLLMTGWFGDDKAKELHENAAKDLAPDVRVLFPDGKDPDLRYSIWSAADIFTLPVDNIQETFGLVPVEAMAAGLPVVCSDWNGFRDTVVDGETGIRVTTRMMRPGMGQGFADRFADQADNYHQYLGIVHQRTAVDVREMAEALIGLINAPERRKAMGEAGLKRARAVYDWSVVIPQYQALWADLAERRARGTPSSDRRGAEAGHPAAIDPFRLYGTYPTGTLGPSAQFTADAPVDAERIEELIALTGAKTVRRIVASTDVVVQVQSLIARRGPISFAELLARQKDAPGMMEAILLWMLKYDLIQVAD